MDIWLMIKCFDFALCLAAVELTFFIAAHMMQCFMFVTKIMFWLLLKYAKHENIIYICIYIYIYSYSECWSLFREI